MQTPRKGWSYNYTVLLLCWFGWITIYLSRSVLPPVLPIIMAKLGLTHTQAGMIATSFMIGYIIIKIPVGFLVRRIGIKSSLILGIIGYGVFSMLHIAARSFLHIFVLRFFVGFFQGIHLPVANTLLSERFRSSQERIIGFHESGPNVGHAIALPIAVAVASAWSWRLAFFLLSLPAFVLAMGTIIILKENGQEVEGADHREHCYDRSVKLRSFHQILIPLALAHSVYNLCLVTLFNFAPLYLVEFRGMSLTIAALISMVLPAAGFFSKVSSGFIAEKLGVRKTICVATALCGLFLLSLTQLEGRLILALIFMMKGLALYSFSPTIYASVTATLPFHLKSIGLGLVTMTGSIVGAFSTPLIGFLIDTQGYSLALKTISSTVLLATLLIYTLLKQEQYL